MPDSGCHINRLSIRSTVEVEKASKHSQRKLFEALLNSINPDDIDLSDRNFNTCPSPKTQYWPPKSVLYPQVGLGALRKPTTELKAT